MSHTRYRTKAVFLKKENRGEADQLFTLFTEDFGKIKILARAVRKITSKLRSGTELFYLSEIEFIQGRYQKTLTDAVLIEKFILVPEITQAIDALMAIERPDTKVWRLLFATLRSLERPRPALGSARGRASDSLASLYFLWQLFAVAGYSPELYNCAQCHKKLLPNTLFFSAEEGGVVCKDCSGLEGVVAILPGTIKVLRLFLTKPITIIEKLKLTPEIIKNLHNVSKIYLNFLNP